MSYDKYKIAKTISKMTNKSIGTILGILAIIGFVGSGGNPLIGFGFVISGLLWLFLFFFFTWIILPIILFQWLPFGFSVFLGICAQISIWGLASTVIKYEAEEEKSCEKTKSL